MSEIEVLISRYLDGELNATQLERLGHLLAESAEARATLREMSAISRAARGTPVLHTPSAALEGRLFQALQSEGLYQGKTAPAVQGSKASLSTTTAVRRSSLRPILQRAGAAVVAILLVVVGSSYWSGLNQGMTENGAAPIAQGLALSGTPRIDRGVLPTIPPVIVPSVSIERSRVRARVIDAMPAPVIEMEYPATPNALEITLGSTAIGISPTIPAPENLAVQAEQPSAAAASVEPFPLPDVYTGRADELSLFAASVRMGHSMIDRERNISADELSLRLDARLGEGHQVSVIVGHSPAIKEMHAENTQAVMASILTAPAQFKPIPLPTYDVQIQKELWVGVGYNYSIAFGDRLRAGVGAKVGTGATSWRVGTEVTMQYQMMEGVALEVAPSASHVIPHDRSTSEFAIDAPDNYIYDAESGRPAFTSYGVELGIRVSIP